MTTAKARSTALVRAEGDLAGPTVEALADQQRVVELGLQRVSDRQDNHERICLDNQTRIDKSFDAVNARLDKIDTGLTSVVTAQAANAAVAAAAIANAKPKWWQTVLGGAILALFGWMASTIWSMETAKVDALQRQPAAAVTVNPAPPAMAPPVAVSPSPPTVPAPPTPDQTIPSTN